MPFDPETFRQEFPILSTQVNGRPLVYLDNAATSQKPHAVLDASRRYYESLNSNVHRGTHHLARAATEAQEDARAIVARHLNADAPEEIVFTSGTTDGINLVAHVVESRVEPGDEILITTLEHHSNIVPWQMLCERRGAKLQVVPCDDHGVLDLDAFHQLLGERTRVFAFTWLSNAFGTIVPAAEMTAAARAAGALVLADAAQAVPHFPVDVQRLGADFLVFSGHKIFAPTGIGVLWGRLDLLESLPPWRGGGEMIKEVRFEGTTYNDPPFKYEAGTPNIEGAIALGAALQFADEHDMGAIHEHENRLVRLAAERLADIDGIHLYGPDDRSASLSFNLDGVHHYDLGTLVDQMGVALRTGHHCCQPLMARFGITGTVRASFAGYNTEADVDAFATAVEKAATMLR